MSTFAHGHHDGNTISRLTWKDRIWLFDLDYIKYTPKFHNGVAIAREGVQEDPPPLVDLDFAADFDELGITRTTARGDSGADWERNIVWLKGGWFLFLDRISAREGGEFRLENRWRTRGDVTLEGRELRAVQGDQQFVIRGADAAPRAIRVESDGPLDNWSNYPYGNGRMDVLLARRDLPLKMGEAWTFANLLWAGSADAEPPCDVREAGDGIYAVEDGSGTMLVGLDAGQLEPLGLRSDAGLFVLAKGQIWLAGLTWLEHGGGGLSFSSPVSMVLEPGTGEGTIVCPDGGPDVQASGKGIEMADGRPAVLKPGRYAVRLAGKLDGPAEMLARRVARARIVQPAAPPAPPVDFGVELDEHAEAGAEITASTSAGGTIFCGDANGRLLRFEGGTLHEVCATTAGLRISAIAAGDLDGDGKPELVAGDVGENLYCFDGEGRMRWQFTLDSAYGAEAYARDIELGDLGDGKPSILVSTGGWKAYAFRPDGSVRWESFVYYHPLTKIRVLETAPGKRYVLAGTTYHTPLNVLDPDGKMQYFTWEQMGTESISKTEYLGIDLREMTFLDADEDGVTDVVFGTLSNHLFALRVADGSKIWEANVGDEVTALIRFDDPAAGGAPRLLVGTAGGDLMLYDRAGTRLARAALGGAVRSLLPLSYEENDRIDLVVGTEDGLVAVCDPALLIRSSIKLERPVNRLVELDKREDWRGIGAVTDRGVAGLGYQPYFLRKSWHY